MKLAEIGRHYRISRNKLVPRFPRGQFNMRDVTKVGRSQPDMPQSKLVVAVKIEIN